MRLLPPLGTNAVEGLLVDGGLWFFVAFFLFAFFPVNRSPIRKQPGQVGFDGLAPQLAFKWDGFQIGDLAFRSSLVFVGEIYFEFS